MPLPPLLLLLQLLVLGARGGVESLPQQDKQDAWEAAWKALDGLLFPTNQAFIDFRNQFLASRFLAPLAALLLTKLAEQLANPCMAITPDPIDIEKPWDALKVEEQRQIEAEPYKWLGKRYYVGFLARLLTPPLRLFLVHVLPCLLVLWYGWTQAAQSKWQLFLKYVFVGSYGLYLPFALLTFFVTGWRAASAADSRFADIFLLPCHVDPEHPGPRVDFAWKRPPEFQASPLLGWLATHVIWGGLGFEMLVLRGVHGARGIDVLPFLRTYAPLLYFLGWLSLLNCLLSSTPGFWDYTGAFLGITPVATFVFIVFMTCSALLIA
ncbi:unnamed protein product [Symbiodinium natans]|uniref:Uncharacterized protein n=1 Tax=Symbiodinium natans TaxID=878477 RepID=A0A812QZ84_9DINO|nr:unnamed protein product [Symbiodinium natans]